MFNINYKVKKTNSNFLYILFLEVSENIGKNKKIDSWRLHHDIYSVLKQLIYYLKSQARVSAVHVYLNRLARLRFSFYELAR